MIGNAGPAVNITPSVAAILRPTERRLPRLFSDAEALNDLLVSCDVIVLDVIEQPATPADQLEQPPAGVMVLLVCLEVLCQIPDSP